MKPKSALILLVILLALSGYLYFYEMPKQETIETAKEIDEKIFAFDETKVQAFTFTLEHDVIKFKKEAGSDDFVIVEPISAKTDMKVINNLFLKLQKVKYVRFLDSEGKDLRDYRLQIPHYKITLDLKDPAKEGGITTEVFRFGDFNMSKTMIYAKRDSDNRIFLVDKDVREILDVDLRAFRDKRLIKNNLEDLGQIQIVRGDEEIVISKDGERWQITKPANLMADIAEVRGLINNIKKIQAVRFPEDNIKDTDKCDFTKPDFLMILTSLDGEVIESVKAVKKGPVVEKDMTMAEREKEDCLSSPTKSGLSTTFFKMASDPATYLITYDDYKDLDKSLKELRSKTIFTLKKEDVFKIQIIKGNKRLVLNKDEKGAWSNISNKNNPLTFNSNDVSKIFNFLNFVKADEFIDDADMADDLYGFKNTTLVLEFYDENGNMLEGLIAGNVEGNYIYLRRLNDRTVYMIDKNFTNRFVM